MFNTIEIENFKAFGERQRLPLRPITLLFGANSSGKSSIIQTLLLLKQTIEEAENPDIPLLPKGKLVNLGSFKEMVFRHDVAQQLTITLGFSMEDRARGRGRFREFAIPQPLENARCAFTFSHAEHGTLRLSRFRLIPSSSDETILECDPLARDPSNELRPMFMFGPMPAGDRLADSCLRFKTVSRSPDLYAQAWNELHDSLPRMRREMDREIQVLQRQLEAASAEPVGDEASAPPARDVAGGPRRRIERRPIRETRDDLAKQLKELNTQRDKLQNYSQDNFISDTVRLHDSLLLLLANYLPTGCGVLAKGEEEFAWFRHRVPHVPGLRYGPESPLVVACLMRCAQLREMLERLLYLGPLREYPERHYIFSGNLVKEVGKSGKGMPDLLFRDRSLVKRVNTWLSRFGVDYTIDVRTVKDPDVEDVFTLRLTDQRTNVTVSPLDVGFGISQILPIIVQSLLAEGRIICVEQPEIHLHPRLQAEFGSLLAEAIKTKQRNQFIIETHSEHLVLRMQRLIRKGDLSPADVAVIYVHKTEAGSTATELRLDESGDFVDEWPEGFFAERLNELR